MEQNRRMERNNFEGLMHARGHSAKILSTLLLTALLCETTMAQSTTQEESTTASQVAGPTLVTSIEGITEYRLPSGLQLLLFPDQSKPSVTVNMTVFVGSRHEGYGEAGMAHLLEHMLFKGTPGNPEIPEELKKRGANFNGTTWHDRTNYYETLPAASPEQAADNLEYAIRMEADRLVNSKVLGEDLQSEMTVVRNEFERGENSPQRVLMQRVQAAAYEWHNYGRVTIGNQSDIERVPVTKLREFYRKFYRPDNVMLVLAGRFDPKQAIELTEKYFGILETPQRPLDRTYTTEPDQDGERTVALRRVGNTQWVMAAYHIPSGANREYAAMEMVAGIMGSEPGGRLYEKIVKPEVASEMFAFPMALHDPGLALFGVQVPVDRSIESARLALVEVLESVGDQPITEEELKRAKNQFLAQRELRASDSTQIAIELSEWAAQGDWRLYFLFRDYVESLTAEECTAVAEQLLVRNNRTVGLFIPTKESQRVKIPAKPVLSELLDGYQGRELATAGEEFDTDPLAIEERITRGELACGLKTAFLQKKTRGNSVNVRIALRYGNEELLTPLSTAVDFLPAMLMRGTQKYDYQQLQDRFDELFARVSPGGQAGLLTISIQTKRENLAEVMEVVGEVLRNPTLDADQFEIMKRQQLAAIEAQKTEPGLLAQLAVQRAMTQYAPEDIRYVPNVDEMIERFEATTLDEVKAAYELVGGQHGEVVAVGDFDAAELQTQVEEMLKDWTVDYAFERIASPARTDLPGKKETIETPDKANSIYFAGQTLAMRDDHPDYVALDVGNFVFGGGGAMGSRLGDRLRKREGLSYSVQSQLTAHPVDKRSMLFIRAIANPSARDQVIASVSDELDRLLTEGISTEELETAKQAMLQAAQVARTQDASLVGLIGNALFAERDLRFNAKREEAIRSLTVDEVNSALRKHIDRKRFVVVTAGDFAGNPSEQDADE